jgi:hypothetical protein
MTDAERPVIARPGLGSKIPNSGTHRLHRPGAAIEVDYVDCTRPTMNTGPSISMQPGAHNPAESL